MALWINNSRLPIFQISASPAQLPLRPMKSLFNQAHEHTVAELAPLMVRWLMASHAAARARRKSAWHCSRKKNHVPAMEGRVAV